MKKLAIIFFILLVTVATGSLTASGWLATADQVRMSENASGVQIIQGPNLESSTDTSAIVQWTTNNTAGTVVRYGVVHFGVDPRRLSQTAKSANRWNSGLPSMIYRVSVDNLEPGLTYYYAVETTDANGRTEGVSSDVRQFTTPRP